MYLPSLMRDWYTWISAFTIQNVGSGLARVRVHYIRDNGDDKTCYVDVSEGATAVIHQADHSECYVPSVPGGWHGSAVVTSLWGQPIVVVANQQLVSNQNHQGYSGFLNGGTILHSPFAAKQYVSGSYKYISASDVQNLGTESTNVIRYYYNWSGSPVWETLPTAIPGQRSRDFYVPAEVPALTFGG